MELQVPLLFTTLIIAFIIIMIAVALLGIGWLITGKSKMRPGACGRDPNQKNEQNDNCGTKVSCQLCEKPKEKKK